MGFWCSSSLNIVGRHQRAEAERALYMDPTLARRLVDHSARLYARVARTAPRNRTLDVAALSSVLLDWLRRDDQELTRSQMSTGVE